MNLFVTDLEPEIAATQLDDKRVGSALREANQMMSLAVKLHGKLDDAEHGGEGKLTLGLAHLNHPVSIWVRETMGNFLWTLAYARACAIEYQVRYQKYHASALRIPYIARHRSCLPAGPLLPFCNQAKNADRGLDFSYLPVPISYQEYLKSRWQTDKRAVTFKNRGEPEWLSCQK